MTKKICTVGIVTVVAAYTTAQGMVFHQVVETPFKVPGKPDLNQIVTYISSPVARPIDQVIRMEELEARLGLPYFIYLLEDNGFVEPFGRDVGVEAEFHTTQDINPNNRIPARLKGANWIKATPTYGS